MDDRVKSCCAGFYELPLIQSLLGDQWHPGGPALTRKLASAVLIGRDSRVLDVASGSGESARVLTQHFGCHVTGVDYSADNCARANAMAIEAGLTEKIHFVDGDAEDLPFAADTFDVVTCECSLCIFPNRLTALNEIQRVLRPGGHLGISDVVVNQAIPLSLQDLFGHVLCIGGALSIDGYREAFAEAGFSSIRSRDVSYALNDMIDRIERRARSMQGLLGATSLELQPGWQVPHSSIVEARDFVRNGGVGYALITGRKPRD
jgi:arsenite methyltransferase